MHKPHRNEELAALGLAAVSGVLSWALQMNPIAALVLSFGLFCLGLSFVRQWRHDRRRLRDQLALAAALEETMTRHERRWREEGESSP